MPFWTTAFLPLTLKQISSYLWLEMKLAYEIPLWILDSFFTLASVIARYPKRIPITFTINNGSSSSLLHPLIAFLDNFSCGLQEKIVKNTNVGTFSVSLASKEKWKNSFYFHQDYIMCVLKKILQPFKSLLINLYFKKIHLFAGARGFSIHWQPAQ